MRLRVPKFFFSAPAFIGDLSPDPWFSNSGDHLTSTLSTCLIVSWVGSPNRPNSAKTWQSTYVRYLKYAETAAAPFLFRTLCTLGTCVRLGLAVYLRKVGKSSKLELLAAEH